MGVSAFMESCLWPSVLHGELKGETSNRLCSVGIMSAGIDHRRL